MLRFSDSRIGVSIADVVGKGLPAALLMSNLQAAVRAFATDGAAPHDVCSSVNRLLCRNIAAGKFVTFCYRPLDTAERTICYANAGHNPPIVMHADGTVERLTAGGTPLGVFADATYEQDQIPLAPGDRLVLFTDGITEAQDPQGDEFGEARLVAQAVRTAAGRRALQQTLVAADTAFTGGVFQDDATLIVIALA